MKIKFSNTLNIVKSSCIIIKSTLSHTMTKIIKTSVLVKICLLFVGYSQCHLEEFYRWKQIQFQHIGNSDNVIFPDSLKQYRDWTKNFIPYNNVPMGVTHFKNKLIITVPRRRPGIPSTLNHIPSTLSNGSSPKFRPFPDIKTNALHPQLLPDSNRIVSVYRPRLDDCDRLWFVDTGSLEYNGTIQIQRPSIWIIDMNTENVKHRFEIPEYVVERGHGLVSLKVDVDKDNCNNAYAYIPDLLNFQIHVYSLQQNKIWSFTHKYFNAEQIYAQFDVDGFQYTWHDGVFSITLGKRNLDGYRTAYFHPMASVSEYAVSTRILQSEEASKRSNHGSDFIKLGELGDYSQSAMHDLDRNSGIIIYTQIAKNAVSCWNSAMPFTSANHAIIDQNNATMIYPVDLNVDNDGTIWVLTNTIQRFIYGKLNTNEYNFRIWKSKVQDAVQGTVCARDYHQKHYWNRKRRFVKY